jgi:predicted nuclease of predicted toxin-antitoxin system
MPILKIRFIVDECVVPSVSKWLIERGFEAFSIFDEWRGASDEEIIQKCHQENYILITSDKDFGEMVYRRQQIHKGVILIRCEPK